MKRHRAQAIVIQNGCVLLGQGCIYRNPMLARHFFLGGGMEAGETPEQAVLRELREEANVEGEIFFALSREVCGNHTTYLVDIGKQTPRLGYDPEEAEEPDEQKTLQQLQFVPLADRNGFTSMDFEYFEILHSNCIKREFYPEWYSALGDLVNNKQQR